jgi:AcrR family transcriptional regulator
MVRASPPRDISEGKQLLPRAERRASILGGAATAFAGSGFAHTSMDDVAASCGITKLIVYRHFETKEELYRAVLQGVFERLGEEFTARMADGGTRGVAARTLLVVAREDPAAFTLLWRHAAREPQFADYAGKLRATAVDLAHELSHLGRDDPVVERWMVEALFGWLVEATLLWLDHGRADRDDEFVEQTTRGLRALRDAWAR